MKCLDSQKMEDMGLAELLKCSLLKQRVYIQMPSIHVKAQAPWQSPRILIPERGIFLELTLHLVLSTHSSKSCLHKIKPVNSPMCLGIGFLRPQAFTQELLAIAGCWGKSQFPWVGCPCSLPDVLTPIHIRSVLIGHSEHPRFFWGGKVFVLFCSFSGQLDIS